MLTRVLILFFLTFPALAQSYLPESTVAAAQTRSAAWCATLKCDGVQTKYWWPVIPLANPDGANNAYIQITPGDPCFDVTTTAGCGVSKTVAPNALGGLTPSERAALKTAAAVSPVAATVAAQAWTKSQVINLVVAPFTDPRNETIAYYADDLPAWLTFNPATITISGTVPASGYPASLPITITGTDASGFSASVTIAVTIAGGSVAQGQVLP